MEKTKKKSIDFYILTRIIGFIKPYKMVFYLTTFLTITLAFLAPTRPVMLSFVIDKFVVKNAGSNNYFDRLLEQVNAWMVLNFETSLFVSWIVLIIGLLVIEAIFQFAQTYLANWLGLSVTIDLRAKLFNHIIRFNLKYFDNTAIGALVTRAVSDIETIAEIFSQGILIIIGDILKLIAVVLVMFLINWKLAIFSLLPIPLLIFATNIFKNAIKKSFQQVRTQVSALNSFVQEHLTGMAIVQIFGKEKEEMEKFRKINIKHRDANLKSVYAYSIFFPVVEMFSAMSMALLIWWGIRGVTNGEIQYGELTAYILFIHMLYRPIRQLADRFNTLQMGIVGAERVFKVLDTQSTINNTNVITNHSINGSIEFKDVWFAYKNDDFVIKGISFDLKAGDTIAFVGATGAGKSSIISLISRLYEFQKGAILIDGYDIRSYSIELLQKSIAVVMQDVFLFSDTILNNITLNNPSISKETVIEAAKIVGVHQYFTQLPGGYDFDVRERGAMLSTGQRQLISFLRAYVHNPKILILDEATSSIDTETELLIQHAINKLTENRTSIVIAHRLSTIKKANVIYVLEKGQIVEHGSHESLIQQNGHYKELYDLQFENNDN